MSEPGISVVMSCYNASETVDRAITSILNQTYSDFEFIIVEDGSQDTTKHMITEWSLRDSRIKLIQNDVNIGLSASLNKGIDAARSQWIARMDADDEALPTRFEKQFSFVQRYPDIDILGTAIITRDKHESISGKQILPTRHDDIIKRIFKKTLVFHPTILIRKSVYTDVGWYDKEIRWAEDADLWYRIYDKVVFHNLEEPLLIYTVKSRLPIRHAISNLEVKWTNLKRRGKTLKYLPYLFRDTLIGIKRITGL